jgi:hypothetical protein
LAQSASGKSAGTGSEFAVAGTSLIVPFAK